LPSRHGRRTLRCRRSRA